MKHSLKLILLNMAILAFLFFGFAILVFNAIEFGIISIQITRVLSLSLILIALVYAIFLIVYTIRSLRSKFYGLSLVYLILSVILIFIGIMGVWMTMVYLGGGAVGVH